jgi:hypothetical protein
MRRLIPLLGLILSIGCSQALAASGPIPNSGPCYGGVVTVDGHTAVTSSTPASLAVPTGVCVALACNVAVSQYLSFLSGTATATSFPLAANTTWGPFFNVGNKYWNVYPGASGNCWVVTVTQ